jgi:hypothetical protein
MRREDELEKIGKEAVKAYFRTLPGIHLETEEGHADEINFFPSKVRIVYFPEKRLVAF